MGSIEQLTASLTEAVATLPTQGPINDEKRNAFYAAYENLRKQIETPIDAAVRVIFGGYDAIALKVAMDTQILNELAIAEGKPKSVIELSKPSGADPLLINRFLRVLAASGLVKETGEGEYAAVSLTGAFSDMSPLSKSAFHLLYGENPLAKLPQYLQKTNYKNPDDSWNGPFQFAEPTDLQYFEWIQQHSQHQEAFTTHMALQRMERGPNWFEFYPVEERLLATDKDTSKAFLVDLGGGVGHDLAAFAEKYPKLAPRLVLEDQEHVLADVDKQNFKLNPNIQRVPTDLFKPQSVKGAKTYYLRTVLHDWPDKQAKEILKNVYDAMSDDSVLILNENALPDQNVSGFQARIDLFMMSILSGIDRTFKQFYSLLEENGFKVLATYRPETLAPGAGTIFEAVKKH
ncbi:o-methyltransferase-like protein [Talaromyces proteolyticus]|uniref:O-methyltransferase-like protein n=1 Tax=Talaromyces proteolyticus TaxID=1131652 RepID=A0AAD4KF30_9EURO|nr:o-methyltransferase-like protein [Talaromyces proteolyticus]KAH8689425.1 o-methyltransferase-like protein [Talaromyces proteolyticus]